VVACGPERAPAGAEAKRRDLDRLLRRVLALKAELGEPTAGTAVALADDVVVATWQAVGLAPLGPLDAQRVLETEGGAARLDLVLSLLEEEAAVLAQRLAEG